MSLVNTTNRKRRIRVSWEFARRRVMTGHSDGFWKPT